MSNWVHDPDQLNALHRAIHKQEGLIDKRSKIRQTGPTPRPIFPEEGEIQPIDPSNPRRSRLIGMGLLGVLVVAAVLMAMQLWGEDADTTPTPTDDTRAAIESATVTSTATDAVPTATDTPDISPTPSLTPTPHPAIVLAMAGVNKNADWSPYYQSFGGVEMALVPTGCFQMGSSDEQLAYAATLFDEDEGTPAPLIEEQPTRRICFDKPFWIDRYEVTNAQFEQWGGVAANPSNRQDPNRPRERLSWDEARAFCALREARLPTEAEWEYAARGPDNLIFPWGNEFILSVVVSVRNSDLQTGVVGERPADMAWVGSHEMVGNVAEWVSTLYRDYPYNSGDGRENTTSRSTRVLRGGSYAFKPINLRAAGRYNAAPNLAGNGFGVRCVHNFE